MWSLPAAVAFIIGSQFGPRVLSRVRPGLVISGGLAVSAVGFILGSNLAPRILRRVRPAYVIGVGLAMATAGLAVLAQVGGSTSADLAILAVASLLVSLGLAPVFTATTDLIVSSAPPERAGAASGISETGAELGGALGIAILGSIGVAVYRGELADTLPAGLPDQAATVARDTLGGAVGVAAQLPAEVGTALMTAAREAFTQGMRLTVILSALVAAVIAVLSTVLLRAVPATAQAEPEQAPAAAAEPARPEPWRPEPVQPEPIQLIRSGAGCVACPGERLPTELPRVKLPGPPAGDPGPSTS